MTDGALVAAQVLWDALLFIVIFAVVPLVLYRAIRLVRASRNIATHFHAALGSAAGIVANTAPTRPALDQTIEVATTILGAAGQLDQHSAAIEALLSQRAGQGAPR